MTAGARRPGAPGVVAAVALAVGLLVALLAAPGPLGGPQPASAVGGERVVYLTSDDGGFTRFVTVQDDDGRTRRLAGAQALGRPRLSPDGTQVAWHGFAADDPNGSLGRYALWVAPADGSAPARQVLTQTWGTWDPAWSPDGRTLAFTRGVNGLLDARCCRVALVGMDGQGLRDVPGTDGGRQPSFDPDGRRLVFVTDGGVAEVGVDGSGRRGLWVGRAGSPSYDPGGDRVAFEQLTGPATGRALVVRLTDLAVSVPSVPPGRVEDPSWTADGERLLYVRTGEQGCRAGRRRGCGWPTRSATRARWTWAHPWAAACSGTWRPRTRARACPDDALADVDGVGVAVLGDEVHVVLRGPDSELLHRFSTDGGQTWSTRSLGGRLVSAPALVAVPDPDDPGRDRLHVYVRGSDDQLYSRTWVRESAWQRWAARGGQLSTAPAAASTGPGEVTVAYADTERRTFLLDGDGTTFGEPVRLGGTTTSAPSLTAWPDGRVEVSVRGRERHLYTRLRRADGEYAFWQYVGGTLASAPETVRTDDETVRFLVRGVDGQLYVRSRVGSTFQPYLGLGGEVVGAPGAASRGDSTAVAVVRTPGGLQLRVLEGGTWGPPRVVPEGTRLR